MSVKEEKVKVMVPAGIVGAKLEMIEQAQKSNPAEAHPFYWAPFVVLGG